MVIMLIKKVVLIAIVGALIFIAFNYGYFRKQADYYLAGPGHTAEKPSSPPLVNEYDLSPNELYIPSLEIRAPVLSVDSVSEEAFQTALARGVVQYPGTAPIGFEGNAYIFGHSSDFVFSKGEYKTIFALLPSIEIGAQILATDRIGKIYAYTVREKFIADKTDLGVLSQGTEGRKVLTLQTSYPVGTALKRYIVRAEISGE